DLVTQRVEEELRADFVPVQQRKQRGQQGSEAVDVPRRTQDLVLGRIVFRANRLDRGAQRREEARRVGLADSRLRGSVRREDPVELVGRETARLDLVDGLDDIERRLRIDERGEILPDELQDGRVLVGPELQELRELRVPP